MTELHQKLGVDPTPETRKKDFRQWTTNISYYSEFILFTIKIRGQRNNTYLTYVYRLQQRVERIYRNI